jgi:hypothetical protein
MTDTTASILEAIVSKHASPYTSTNPSSPLFNGNSPPIHPLIRSTISVDAEGPAQPGSIVRFRLPSAKESDIHLLEAIWLEFSINDPSGFYDPSNGAGLIPMPAGVGAISFIELRTKSGTLIETIDPTNILMWDSLSLTTPQLRTTTTLAHAVGMDVLQVGLPICILKDGKPFPYISLRDGLEIRLKHSNIQIPGLFRKGTRLWMTGRTLPQTSLPLYDNKEWVLPITTFHIQKKVFEKGSISTTESFLLEDPRDLQEIIFILQDDPPTRIDVRYGPGNMIYNALEYAWVEIGTERITEPLRPEIVRTISCIGRHSRVPLPAEGFHIIPISNVPQPSIYGYTSGGLMSHIQPKLSLRLQFKEIDRPPGDRLRFQVSATLIRGQRLKIRKGEIVSLDESFGDPDKATEIADEDLPDPTNEINPNDPGSLASTGLSRPKGTIGYLRTLTTHEPFSRITRNVALRGSHKIGDVIVASIRAETDYISDLIFRARLPQLPNTGVRWVNGVGYSLMKRVVIRHDDIILYDSPGEALFLLEQQTTDLADRGRRDAIDKGYRSPYSSNYTDISLTNYRETATPDGYIRVPVPWPFSRRGSPPLPTFAFKNRELQLEIHLADPEDVAVLNNGEVLPAGELREEVRKTELTEAIVDVIGYNIPSEMMEESIKTPQIIRVQQLRTYKFMDEEGTLRNIPLANGLRRLFITSPNHSICSPGDISYSPIEIIQIYSGSTPWYDQTQPIEFFEDWTRIRQASGEPDIRLLCLDNLPGFINASRLDEFRIQTTPGRLLVVAEIEELYRIQEGKIGPLFIA